MCQEGVCSPVNLSYWAAPVGPVLKPHGSLRICGNFKATLNFAWDIEQYLLLKVEDIFASLKGGYWFSTLDLREAYWHVLLEEESKQEAVMNTPKGLFDYNRSPYRIFSAPALFQKMEAALRSIPGTQVSWVMC